MFDRLEIFRMSHALAAHAGARQLAAAGNVAQADTPGYRARGVEGFAETWARGEGGDMRATRAGHFTGAPAGAPRTVVEGGAMEPGGNAVSLEGEMTRAALARGDHDMALGVYRSALSVLRASLGRR